MTVPGAAIARRYLGKWGSRLGEASLADALVAAGVLQASPYLLDETDPVESLRELLQTSDWPIAWRVPEESLSYVTAGEAAKAAKGAAIRLAVEPGFGIQSDLYPMLRFLRSATFVTPHVRASSSGDTPYWHWPLRMGILIDRPSQALRRAANQSWPDLRDLVDPGEGCDLLLLPWSASAADRKPALPEVGKVGMVVLMGPIDVAPREVARVADRLALRFDADGCHLANRPERLDLWFRYLIEGLAHNAPLDLALTDTQFFATKRPHYTTISGELASAGRLEWAIGRLADHLSQLGGSQMEIPPGMDALLPGFNLQGPTPAGAVGDYLQEALRAGTFTYVHETNEASGVAALVRASAGLLSPGDLATANGHGAGGGGEEGGEQVRIINGVVKQGDTAHRLALEAGSDCTLEVWIGVQSEESITEPGAPAFPDEELPAGPQQIDVVFTCLGNREEVQRDHVTLPDRGDSKRALFKLNFAKPGPVFGRMALAHGGRVLQTAVLRADVVAERPSRLGRPAIEVEEVIRASFTPVAEEDQFDLAVVVNRDMTGKRTASAIRKEGVTIRSVDGLQAQITELKDALTSIADDPDAFASMTSEDTLSLLFDLANLGEGLHNAFVKDHDIKESFFKRGRVQIISAAADSYLPVELFYALRAPTEMKLCRDWKKSVLAGTCQSCEALGPNADIPICFTGFWGVRYVVERHVHNSKFANLRGDYRLQNEPGAGRDQIRPLESVLWGVSNNVMTADRSSLSKALSKKNFAATKAKTWSDVQEKVSSLDPSMVFLLPHTDMKGRLFATEIGGELEQVNLLGRRMCEPREKKFVVILLGCDTARTDIPFQGMVPRFRQAGAAVVVTTINTILGRHAVPVAKELLRLLKDIGAIAAGRSMGEVMRDLRRQALHDGYPMVLSVVAFGDADWRLTA